MNERGFTLIELLTIITIIGILASLSISSINLYKASAAYAVAGSTVRYARSALEAALTDADNPPAAVPAETQSTAGPIVSMLGRGILPGMQIPKNVTIEYEYDPSCIDLSCPWEVYLQAKHCSGREYVRWIRFGDGTESYLEHISGSGC